MHVAWFDPPLDEDERRARREEQSRLRVESRLRNAAISAALQEVPRFTIGGRTYYLLGGPVSAVTQLRDPGNEGEWRNPDLVWPDDRSWFVATDVDFWSLYIGGDKEFINELAASAPTQTEIVAFDYELEIED